MNRLAYVSFVVLAACATNGDPLDGSEQDTTATTYVSIEEFGNGAEDAWDGIRDKLNGEFAQVCGDTFCGGDYANITPLSVFCSVTSKNATVHDCAWTFTASQHAIDPKLGTVVDDVVTYQCHWKPKTSGPKLIAALQNADDALHATLPGMGSIYDTLSDCFAHPIGATPITVQAGTTYVDANDYYVSRANLAAWTASLANLHRGFDDVCGDTFCGSDFSDVQALDLGCAVTKSTGNVKACAWSFGGSYGQIAKAGDVAPVTKTWTCPVAVHGTIGAMITVLTRTVDPETNAIQRPLPGGTAAYDSIAGCVTR
ncbi:MAG TPA: hypothetical protein VFQ65_02445 [Kofleriaceae bacterium]|nr:hypothetical protein [Kofleriaceae bacterium]